MSELNEIKLLHDDEAKAQLLEIINNSGSDIVLDKDTFEARKAEWIKTIKTSMVHRLFIMVTKVDTRIGVEMGGWWYSFLFDQVPDQTEYRLNTLPKILPFKK